MVDDRRTTHLTDISEYETDMQCGMKLWYSKYEKKNGVLLKEDVLPTKMLYETHQDLRTLTVMEDISAEVIQESVDRVLSKLTDNDKKNTRLMEILYRRLGWFAAFALYLEPNIRKAFETVDLDPWIYLDRDPLWVTVEPDRLLRNKFTKEVVYQEYVPTLTTSRVWLESWERQARPQVGMAAAREYLKTNVDYGQIRGLNLGIAGHHRLIHPYVYGTVNKVTGIWCASTYRQDTAFEERPVWEYPGGIVKWVMFCGEDTAVKQFPVSPRVDPDYQALLEWVAHRTNRMRTIAHNKESCQNNQYLRSVNFIRNPTACKSLLGDNCPYADACWDKDLRGRDLVTLGMFVPAVTPSTAMVKAEVTV